MHFLKRISELAKSVPLWIWLFLTLTQVMSVAASADRLWSLEEFNPHESAKGQNPQEQAWIDQDRDLYEGYRRRQVGNIVAGLVFGPAFLAIGLWARRANKRTQVSSGAPVAASS